MRYRDRKGNEYNGENGQDRLLAFDYGHAVTRLLIRPLLSPIVSRIGGAFLDTRISGLAEPREDRYRLSILKSADGDPSSVRRCFYEYTAPKAGRGHFIHTYQGDGNPLPSFEGEPAEITLKGDIDAFTEEVWNSLNADNRVSLFTRYIRLSDGKTETRLVNKNQ